MGGARLGSCRWGPASPPVAQIPRSYLSLREAMLAEQQRRSLGDDVQYLTDRQLEQLVEQMPDKDIKDYEDLQSGEWAPRWREAGGGCRGSPGKGQSHVSLLGTCLQVTVRALGVVVTRRAGLWVKA